MSDYTEAADFIKRQANVYRGFVQLSDALDRIGSVELAAKEAQDARASAELDRDVAQAALSKINNEIDAAKDEAARVLVEAGESARTQAARILADAREEADRVLASATANASQALASANAKADQVRADYQALQVLSDGLKETVASQRDAVGVAQKELERITAEVVALKAKFA